jgi:hypothetical protein
MTTPRFVGGPADLIALPFLANRPVIAPLNLNGLRCFCKPETLASPPRMTTRRSGSAKGVSCGCQFRSAFGELRKCTQVPPRPKATRLTPGADIEGPITVGSDQALVSGSLQSFLDTSDKVVRNEWLV